MAYWRSYRFTAEALAYAGSDDAETMMHVGLVEIALQSYLMKVVAHSPVA